MNKQTKIIIGLSALLGIGYILTKNRKKSFSASLYDSCVNDGNDPQGCCDKQGGIFTPPKYCVPTTAQGEQEPMPMPTPMPLPPLQLPPQGEIPSNPEINIPPKIEIPVQAQTQQSIPSQPPTQFPISEQIQIQQTTPSKIILPIGGSFGGGGNQGSDKKIMDWIPYILAGMTIALSFVSESKE